jgi:hypothetical protein
MSVIAYLEIRYLYIYIYKTFCFILDKCEGHEDMGEKERMERYEKWSDEIQNRVTGDTQER